MIAPKRVLITAGGTREYIDDVRVVTNISTGALGARIAEEFYARGWQVYYLHSKQGAMPRVMEGISDSSRISTYQYVTVQDLMENMKWLVEYGMDVVVHSAAVSDFTFKRDGAVKLSSGSPEAFIEYMRKTITPTPKIIQEIKRWDPRVTLVGFKFTVGNSWDELRDIAVASGKASSCDFVVANDKEIMRLVKDHAARVCRISDGSSKECVGKDNIARAIYSLVG